SFKDRDKTGLNTLLIADLSDIDGINSTGLGFGHEITMVLDDDESEVTVLNDYFEQDPGRYQSGTVTYPMTGLTMGMHTLTLRAWDLFNNSSEKTIHFFAYSDSSLTATNVMNFPNPFSEGTTFSITPKTGSGTIGVTIEICSLIGQPVTTLNFAYESAADGPVTYYWNGTNGNGEKLRSGLYPYRVTLTGQNGMETRTSGKLVIIR
ncbi:MAG TPA: FlgD immunoglobulin-like domain containing protein, partial [Bacteroidales bacterium]|nr:FlgD immunoglobulin-like domain containing protein [Bacteroidales bacterium]